MTEEPQTWHYGLVAELWSAGDRQTRELDFLRTAIKTYGEPVLDLACGAGRLLVPLREDGIDIEGADLSPDMLAGCRAALDRRGLSAELHLGPMHTLNIPRKHRLIYIADSFGLAGSRTLDELAFIRAYEQLEQGGALILNLEAPYALDDWPYWQKEKRTELPAPWPAEPRQWLAEDGTEYSSQVRLYALNPLEQTFELEIRVEKHHSGELVGEELRSLKGSYYFRNELVAMLEKSGFREVRVYGGYSELPATAEDEELVYLAIK